jgi:putative SOS response-associated peptidase YedK
MENTRSKGEFKDSLLLSPEKRETICWDMGQAPWQEHITACAIITCVPNALMSTVHNRIPAIFDASTGWEWLSQKPAA